MSKHRDFSIVELMRADTCHVHRINSAAKLICASQYTLSGISCGQTSDAPNSMRRFGLQHVNDPAVNAHAPRGWASNRMTPPGELDWRLQPLAVGDAPSVLDLLRVAFATTEVPLDPPPGALRETIVSLETHILSGGGAAAISGKRMIGSALWIVADGLYVSRIAVLPQWRRRGIGSALLVACEDEARRRGQRRLHLETRLVLAGNLRLFARFGYREFARLPPDGDPGKALIKLEKRIE
jgi:ribosomal protein S18 acetylase RimI-like enzyme